MKSDISVVIVARDEEMRIEGCIKSVPGFSEIVVVVDDRTTDNTAEIARKLGARVITKSFVDYSQIKNFAISQVKSGWVLLLDADERPDRELLDSIDNLADGGCQSYNIAFKNYLGDKWLRYGGLYPDYHVRLFKSNCRYQGEVHEKLILDKPPCKLSGAIIHHTYSNVEQLYEKVRRYAPQEGKGKSKGQIKASIAAAKRWVGVYIARLGVLDGWYGLQHANAMAYYQYLVYKPESEK